MQKKSIVRKISKCLTEDQNHWFFLCCLKLHMTHYETLTCPSYGVWTDVGCQNLRRVHEVLSVGCRAWVRHLCRRSEPQEGAEDIHTAVAGCRDWSPGKVRRLLMQEGRLTRIAGANRAWEELPGGRVPPKVLLRVWWGHLWWGAVETELVTWKAIDQVSK